MPVYEGVAAAVACAVSATVARLWLFRKTKAMLFSETDWSAYVGVAVGLGGIVAVAVGVNVGVAVPPAVGVAVGVAVALIEEVGVDVALGDAIPFPLSFTL